MTGVPQEIGPAGLLRRLGAMVYDILVVVALVMVTLFLLTGLNRFEAVHGPWVNAILFLEIYAFFAFFWVRRGQTLGMLAWRLRVQNSGGVPITLTQATLRFIGALRDPGARLSVAVRGPAAPDLAGPAVLVGSGPAGQIQGLSRAAAGGRFELESRRIR